MAWTAPRTYVTGELVTASVLNTDVRDNIKEVWREISYTQITTPFTTTATTEATAGTVVADSARTYTAEPIEVKFFAPRARPTTAGVTFTILFSDGGTALANMGDVYCPVDTAGSPVYVSHRFTPTAASHTYMVECYVSTGAGTAELSAGAGAGAAYVPAYLQIMQKGS